ncbi:hypothetical protein BJV77DRAFT_766027 [Russula vinacea]|nr:hypothetical protein BJV77DRAFT_766027 [Russula vinacea]
MESCRAIKVRAPNLQRAPREVKRVLCEHNLDSDSKLRVTPTTSGSSVRTFVRRTFGGSFRIRAVNKYGHTSMGLSRADCSWRACLVHKRGDSRPKAVRMKRHNSFLFIKSCQSRSACSTRGRVQNVSRVNVMFRFQFTSGSTQKHHGRE